MVRQYGVLVLTYFGIVFASGFVLGVFRVLVLLPRMPERQAELLEMPLMLVVVLLAARYLVTHNQERLTWRACLGIGVCSLLLMVCTEFTVVLGLRGMTVATYLDSRDWVSGGAYIVSLIIFALAPLGWFTVRSRSKTQR